MNKVYLNIDDLAGIRFRARLERLEMGLPLKIKDKRKRDPEKQKALTEFFLNTTPPAEDILSGKAFRELLSK